MIFSNKVVFICLLIFSGHIHGDAQVVVEHFSYRKVPSNLIETYSSGPTNVTIPTSAFYVDKLLNGNENIRQITGIIQKSIDENSAVVLPNKRMTISQIGISLRSNSVLIFQPRTELVIEGNSLDYYQLLKIHNVSNVKIYNANIRGDRNVHKSQSGEWGYGISIRSSSNVLIENAKISDFWGDGIAIGYGTTSTSTNIVLSNLFIDNNRRNGISIMNVNGLVVKNSLIANTNGTSPSYGIDIEPNNGKDYIDNIKIQNVLTYNNSKGGLMVTFNRMKPKIEKYIYVNVNGYRDIGSPQGVLLAGIPKEAIGLKGEVVLNNILLEKNSRPITGRTINNNKVKFNIRNLNIKNPKNKNYNNEEVGRVLKTKSNYSIKFGT